MVVVGALTGDTVNVVALHIAEGVCAGTMGSGLTVTVMVNVLPVQVPAAPDLGVTV